MLLSQIQDRQGRPGVVARHGTEAYLVKGVASVYGLALDCIRRGARLADRIAELGFGAAVDLEAAYDQGRLLGPIAHPDPAHLHLTGTGFAHRGLAPGQPGLQPVWFYKGDGDMAVAPGWPLASPALAGGGEEPGIAGCYVIGDDGTPFRIGFVLANAPSGHGGEPCPASFGPEILLGELPEDIRGTARIRRGGAVVWEKPFLSGEAHMARSLASLERHHFEYGLFRRPGDVHIHKFGAAMPSFAEGVRTEGGDMFEIEAPPFGLPLRNPLAVGARSGVEAPVPVHAL